MDKFFSIVTVNYNNVDGLKKTINSIKNQKCRDFEYIVIDADSNDGSVEVIKNEEIIDKYVIEKDEGIFHGLNKGIRVSSGKYIIALNSGDLLVTDRTLLDMKEKILEHKEPIGVFYGNAVYRLNDRVFNWKYPFFSDINVEKWNRDYHPVHQSAFISKEIYDCINYDKDYKMVGDYKLFTQIKQRNPYYYIPIDVCYFELEGIGTSSKSLKNNILKSFEILTVDIIYGKKREKIVKRIIINLADAFLKYFIRKIIGKDYFYKLMKLNQERRIRKYRI